MTYAAVPSVLQNGVVVYQNVKNAHELERILVAAPVEVGAEHERMYVGVMLQRDPQNQRLYLHDAITEKELDIRGTEHLKTHRGSDTTNSELYTADILRNALNVKSEQLSAIQSFVWDFLIQALFRLSDSFQLFCGISVLSPDFG